jgi:hypothetical protein
MSPPTGSGLRKDTPLSSDDITTRLDQLDELIRAVTSDLQDVKQQGLSVSLIRLEQTIYGSGDGAGAMSATNAVAATAIGGDHSVTPPPNSGNGRPPEGLSYPVFLCQNRVLIVCMTQDQLFHTYG